MNTKFLTSAVVLAACSLLSGCGSDSSSDLGTQIDAMGRAAVNTALINPFTSDAVRSESENEFNSTDNSDRSHFRDTMASQFAIYDALVGTCGDNPITNRASANPADGLATGAHRYNFIASVFADDYLYVNSQSGGSEAGQCGTYLAVEAGVIGVTGLEADCGGRTILHDTIATTYSAVSIGALSGVDDGISSDSITHSLTEFPFISAAR